MLVKRKDLSLAKIILIENDVAKMIMQKASPKVIKLHKLPCSAYITLTSDGYKEVNSDPLLQALLTESATEEYKAYLDKMVLLTKKSDQQIISASNAAQKRLIFSKYNAAITKITEDLQNKGESGAKKAWDKAKKTKEDYQMYKIKSGLEVAGDVKDMAVAVLETWGTAGITFIKGLYDFTKALVKTITKLVKLWRDAEKLQKRVAKNLKTVQAKFKKQNKILAATKEVGKDFINNLLGSDFLPTVKSVKADNDQLKNKYKGVDVASHAAARELQTLLNKVDNLTSKSEIKKNKKMNALITKLESAVASQINRVIDMREAMAKGITFQSNTAAAIKELETWEPKKFKLFRQGLDAAEILYDAGLFESSGVTAEKLALELLDVAREEMVETIK